MNCEQAEELLGAWAVDALPDDEAADLRAHLATCAEHAAKARELRTFASDLSLAVDPLQPPPRLRDRVMAAVAREAQLAHAGQPSDVGVGRPSPAVITDRARLDGRGRPSYIPWRGRWARDARAWGALAAAVIAGLLVWNVVLQTGGDDGGLDLGDATAVSALDALGVEGGGTAYYFDDEKEIVLVANGLAPLDASRTYQMWTIAAGQPASAGLLRPNADGIVTATVPFDASRDELLAITIEPAGGSDQPTSSPIYVATIEEET
jgi:hypothetical protein